MLSRLASAALLFASFVSGPAFAQEQGASIRNIVLVHGAWADGSSWSKVIPILAERGFNVVAVQNPLTSLQDDVAATNQAIERLETVTPGPVLLVGHSYGGTIITQAGDNPNVTGLVYIAAFAPEEGQTSLDLYSGYPPTPIISQLVEDEYGFLTVSRQGVFEDFARDLSVQEKENVFATQGPTSKAAALSAPVTTAAWRVKPCWFVVAANDRVIPPQLEEAEAKQLNAVTITVPTSHVAMIAAPKAVADFITQAARPSR